MGLQEEEPNQLGESGHAVHLTVLTIMWSFQLFSWISCKKYAFVIFRESNLQVNILPHWEFFVYRRCWWSIIDWNINVHQDDKRESRHGSNSVQILHIWASERPGLKWGFCYELKSSTGRCLMMLSEASFFCSTCLLRSVTVVVVETVLEIMKGAKMSVMTCSHLDSQSSLPGNLLIGSGSIY